MNRVAVLRSQLLPISETFIRDQVSSLKDWTPILVGRQTIQDGLETPGIQRLIVPESGGRLTRALRYWRWNSDPALVKHLRQLEIRLAHVHFGIDAIDFWPSVRAAGIPMLITLHGMDINIHRWWWEQGHGGLRRRVYPWRLLKLAQEPSVKFIAVSLAIQQRAIEYGIPKEKISVCNIGVDTARLRPAGLPIDQRPKRVLFVGRMVEKKSPLLMIRAYAEVRRHIPDAELTMIGAGPLLDSALSLAKDLNAPVHFLGACNSDDVIAQLHQARILCLPSVTASNGDAEGFGMVLLEAQSCGVPVISSAMGGAEEGLLNGITGYKFEPGNSTCLAFQIRNLLENSSTLVAMSQAASAYVTEQFDIHKLTQRLSYFYSSTARPSTNTGRSFSPQ